MKGARLVIEWRQKVPLGAHAEWARPAKRTDPLDILVAQEESRIPELLPVRYARMKADPFALSAAAPRLSWPPDLAANPTTGLRVQSCGDCTCRISVLTRRPTGYPGFRRQ